MYKTCPNCNYTSYVASGGQISACPHCGWDLTFTTASYSRPAEENKEMLGAFSQRLSWQWPVRNKLP
ncbi:MAG: hypothetical protein PHO24_07090 [Clostridia bacterium]|mgnify:FL=1|nr:hypothetical protein [Clostridia bacterium]